MAVEIMETPNLISPFSVSSLKADRHKRVKGSFTNRNSVKSLASRSFSGLNFQLQSHKKPKSVKGNSRKKLRKKGKLNKKISSDTGLNELEYAHAHINSKSMVDANVSRGTDYPEFSIVNEDIQDTNCKSITCYDEPCSSVFSETSNSVLLDSSSLGSSSDRSFNADGESTASDISRNRVSSFASISNDVVGPDSQAVWEKREKPVKKVVKNYKVGKASNLHGRFRKENSHSVWQRVQRNDDESTKVNSICSNTVLSSSEDKSTKLKKKSNPNGTQINGKRVLETDSRSHSKIIYPKNRFQTKKVESLIFIPVLSSQVSPSDSNTNISYLNDQNPENGVNFEGDKEVFYSKKWIPIGVKDSTLPLNLSSTKIDESANDSCTFQITEKEETSSDSVEQSDEAVNGSDSEDRSNNHADAERVIHASENESSEIVRAVNDACKAQLASEAVQTATGYPIAEFERLLLSASPVICPSDDIVVSCQSCDRVKNSSVCEHEKQKICIGSLWQWYEKHGTYGLEVKAEDNERSIRLGADCADFCAYFVPFLSAIQLFRKSNNDEIRNAENNDFELTFEDSELEVMFEFFESEQPQKRRPLFQMIKQLVKGDSLPNSRVNGDPSILDSVDFHDLHPKSWYSVAWYPIYRIPDGNFRAAFLTYHSLGHLVKKCSTFDDALCSNPCIISPVVGLQSYNAQDECWFQPRYSSNRLNADVSNLEGILKERLSTLELTASLMARAVVTKGTQTHTNRQPDYEFFVSRQRW